MSTQTVSTGTCDICNAKESYKCGTLPDNWVKVVLHKRLSENSVEFHSLDLCLSCQETALKALKSQKAGKAA